MGGLCSTVLALCLYSVTLVTGCNVFCDTLKLRSIAPYAPFQLPLDLQRTVPDFVWSLSSEPYSMEMEWNQGWLYVDRHNCSSHAMLMEAFQCN